MSNHHDSFPHCDDLVLHRPQTCWACDLYPERQALREHLLINFTGEHDPAKAPCPAEVRRPIETINRWYNNTAKTREQADADHAEWQREFAASLARLGVSTEEL